MGCRAAEFPSSAGVLVPPAGPRAQAALPRSSNELLYAGEHTSRRKSHFGNQRSGCLTQPARALLPGSASPLGTEGQRKTLHLSFHTAASIPRGINESFSVFIFKKKTLLFLS